MKTKSYISDPEWNNSFVGRFLWLYRGSGMLEWEAHLLTYSDKKRELQIEKTKIIEITLGRYRRTAKPITLNFIEIAYKDDDSEEKRVFFTTVAANKHPWVTPVWTANVYVKECLEKINQWRNS